MHAPHHGHDCKADANTTALTYGPAASIRRCTGLVRVWTSISCGVVQEESVPMWCTQRVRASLTAVQILRTRRRTEADQKGKSCDSERDCPVTAAFLAIALQSMLMRRHAELTTHAPGHYSCKQCAFCTVANKGRVEYTCTHPLHTWRPATGTPFRQCTGSSQPAARPVYVSMPST